jgi:hypothetical protein
MNDETVRTARGKEESYVRLPAPIDDPDAFRYGATADVLHLLVDNPDRPFTNRALHRVNMRTDRYRF